MDVKKPDFLTKDELKVIAKEVLDSLRSKKLPIWQVKEVCRFAMELADWELLK